MNKPLQELKKDELTKILLIEQAVCHKFAEALWNINDSQSLEYIEATIKHAMNMERTIRNNEAKRLVDEAKVRLEGDGVVTLEYLIEAVDNE